MSFNFESVEHALASVAQDVVKDAKAVENFFTSVQSVVTKDGPTVVALEGAATGANSKAVTYTRAAFNALGLLTKAVLDTGSAIVDGKGINIPLDEAAFADWKAFAADLHTKATTTGALANVATPGAAVPNAA